MDDQATGGGLSRRDFAFLTTVAAASAGRASAAPATRLTDVEVKTPDGTCDGVLIHPAEPGKWPAVLIWPDALGLRQAYRAMGARLAGEGYAVLIPNQFYRTRRPPIFPQGLNMADPASRAALTALREPLTQAAVMRDAVAHLAFLDAQPVVNTKAKAGVTGYCMGGAMTLQTAAAVPQRIGAGCSFHGSRLATDQPDSPHLLVPRIKAPFYFAFGADDAAKEPQAPDMLRQAFARAGLKVEVEVYPDSKHGWTIADGSMHNPADAERAWAELTALFKSALV